MKIDIHMKKNGTLTIELVVAIVVMGVLISVLATLGNSFQKLNNQLWLRHTCSTAGQAQLDSLSSTGSPICQETFERLWPNVTCSFEVSEGTGDWKGLRLVNVHMTAESRGKTVRMTLTRYVPGDKEFQI